jgi:hypothetical protein
MAIKIQHSIRTLRLKVKAEEYAWLNKAAIEVNDVWNFANATSSKAARPFAGPATWLTGYDLDKLTAGATEYFEHIGVTRFKRSTPSSPPGENRLEKRSSAGGRAGAQGAPWAPATRRRQARARPCVRRIQAYSRKTRGSCHANPSSDACIR